MNLGGDEIIDVSKPYADNQYERFFSHTEKKKWGRPFSNLDKKSEGLMKLYPDNFILQ